MSGHVLDIVARPRGPLAKTVLRRGYNALAGSPLWLLCDTRLLTRLSRPLLETDAADAVRVVRALQDAGVSVWIAGGWGVDALVGVQTRRHADVDVVIPAEEHVVETARSVLLGLGMRFLNERHSDVFFSRRLRFGDATGRGVDLLPLDMIALRAAASENGRVRSAFAVGTIGGATVPCLSAALQLAVHAGYPSRAVDHLDLAQLRQNLPAQEGASAPT